MLSVMMINKTEALLLLCPNACGKNDKQDKTDQLTEETNWNHRPGVSER